MITLKDVLKLNPFVTLLNLDVRDADTRLLKHVIIGKNYHLTSHQRYDECKGILEYIDADINKHGRANKAGQSEMAYDIDWKAIPKQYLEMEVDLINSITERYGVNNDGMELRANVVPIQIRMDCAWK